MIYTCRALHTVSDTFACRADTPWAAAHDYAANGPFEHHPSPMLEVEVFLDEHEETSQVEKVFIQNWKGSIK